MQSIHERMVKTIQAHEMLSPGDRVAVAVSGGPDSLALLILLSEWAPRHGLNLLVAHFNHHLRGKESDGDEEWVRRTAERFGLECRVGEEAVGEYSRAHRMNLELAARQCRYRFLRTLAESDAVTKVALGHTANDQAETFLMRLLRGTGTHGLASIYPLLDGYFVRPLLDVTRDEVEKFLCQRNLDWREDSSNKDLNRTRNRLRRELLPDLAKKYNPEIVRHLARTAALCRADDQALNTQAMNTWRQWSTQVSRCSNEKVKDGCQLPLDGLRNLVPAVRSRVLRLAIESAKGDLRRIDESHVIALERLLDEGQSGDKLDFPDALGVERSADSLWIVSHKENDDRRSDYELKLPVPGKVVLPYHGLAWKSHVLDSVEWGRQIPKENGAGADEKGRDERALSFQACFDYSKISDRLGALGAGLRVRNVRPGDRYHPRGRAHPVKVNDLLSERHVLASGRPFWPLLLAGDEIIWVRGCAESRQVAASRSSHQILVIEEVQTGGKRD